MLLKNNFHSNEHSVLRYKGNTPSNTHTPFQHKLHVQQTCPACCYCIISRSTKIRQKRKRLGNSYCWKYNPAWKPCGEPTGVRGRKANGMNAAPARGTEPWRSRHSPRAPGRSITAGLYFPKHTYNMPYQKGCNNNQDSLATILAINMLICLKQLRILIPILEHICLLTTRS